jgi:hypothetical protein
MTLFQGLTLLIFKSDACTNNPFFAEFPANSAAELLYTENCRLDSGTIANIVGIVCWFLAGLVMMVLGQPQTENETAEGK